MIGKKYTTLFTKPKITGSNNFNTIVHQIIPSKQIRHRWKISSNPFCPICDQTETYEHLFIDCDAIQHFWSKIASMFEQFGIINNVQTLSQKSDRL